MHTRDLLLLPIALLVATWVPKLAAEHGQEDVDSHNGFPPATRIESRQGFPGKADVISHKRLAKNTRAKCISVQYNPEQTQDGETPACLLRFSDGKKHALRFNETLRLAKEQEVYLECLGGKPAACVVGVWLESQ